MAIDVGRYLFFAICGSFCEIDVFPLGVFSIHNFNLAIWRVMETWLFKRSFTQKYSPSCHFKPVCILTHWRQFEETDFNYMDKKGHISLERHEEESRFTEMVKACTRWLLSSVLSRVLLTASLGWPPITNQVVGWLDDDDDDDDGTEAVSSSQRE